MRALVTTALWLASTSGAMAQTIYGGSLVETYSMRASSEIGLESVRLLTLPFGGQAAWRNVILGIDGAYADGSMTLASGERNDVSGLTDTRASVDVVVGDLVVSAAALLGTGDVVSTEEEAMLVGLLSTDLLPFAVHQWGTGGGFTADVGYAVRLGDVTLGLSAGGSASLETKPLSAGTVYRPGRELRGRASIEAPAGAAGVASIAFGMQRFEADTYGDRDLYRSGTRWEAVASYAFAVGPRESVLLFGAVEDIRGGKLQVGSFRLDPRGLAGAVGDRAQRTTFRAGVEVRLDRGRASLVPRAQWRALRREDGVGQGWIGSAGASAEVRLLTSGYRHVLVAEPTVDLSLGSVTATDSIESSIFGWRAGVVVRWSVAP